MYEMPVKTICFGFDGICCDMSYFIPDLPKYKSELLIKYPFLDPILSLLLSKQPEDCELQFESTEFGFETFFDCIFTLNEIAQKKTTLVGGNAAIETVSAMHLLKDPVYPLDFTRAYFLGNFSPEVSQKLPKEQKIAAALLEHANQVKTSYIPISIIIPYNEKRGIVSFGGLPGIRRVESLRPYLKNLVPVIQKLNPDLMSILGTTNVYATTTNYNDFTLLDPFLSLNYSAIDLGGTVGWGYDRLKQFYQVVDKAKMVIGNDDEFRAWYNFKYKDSIQDSDPLTIFRLVKKLRKESQIAVCHTQFYQFVLGLDDKDTVRDCMNFANRATVVKTEMNMYPTARQVADMLLMEKSIQLPSEMEVEAIVSRSIDKVIVNPVGLGDLWSCSFNIGLLSQNIL